MQITEYWIGILYPVLMSATHVIVFLFVLTVSSAEYCHNGWVSHDSSCYFFADFKTSWPMAEAYCKDFKGSLVEITNADENNFVGNTLRRMFGESKSFWTGGTDIIIENEWEWIDSEERFSYLNWIPGQPDNYNSVEDCSVILSSTSYLWNDVPCNSTFQFVCERRPTNNGDQVLG